MPAERAGYTVTMFLVDTSPSMGKTRTVQLPDGPNSESRTTEMTDLEWALQFVKLKIQEMIYNGRKTDQCGVILFGSEGTDNIINDKNGGYENVTEYIQIAQANGATLMKIDEIEPSSVSGDPIDALIVGIETQAVHLGNKKTWTRKIVLITDGESPIEIEDWEATVSKMEELNIGFTLVGVDFDDEEFPFVEEDKSDIKRTNEEFYHTFTEALPGSVLGTCALALRETTRPDIKQTKSVLASTVLRLGDVDIRPEEAVEISVKTSKCTAIARAKGWKKFALREDDLEEDGMDVDNKKAVYAQLKMRSEYYIEHSGEASDDEDEDIKMEYDDADEGFKEKKEEGAEKVDKEQLIRGFKYGSTYAPCPDGLFPRLNTRKGMDICGFFQAKNFRRELSMGEVQYVWADPGQPSQQVALSSIVRAMDEKDVFAIARWVSRDGMDPKMGVLAPTVFENVDCLLWAPMPFADDVRKYTFASLTNLVSKKGEPITEHPYIPTPSQTSAMDALVDAMDLMDAGEKDEETGEREQWFDTRLSYNPAVHRTKQALFHCAVVNDLERNPLPPPHPELLKYFETPKRVANRASEAVEECKRVFKVREVPKKVARARKDEHVRAQDDDDEMLLLDRQPPRMTPTLTQSEFFLPDVVAEFSTAVGNDGSDTEEDEEVLLLDATPAPEPAKATTSKPKASAYRSRAPALPTPTRSLSPPATANADMPDIEPGRAEGRVVGSTYPLKDFKESIRRGDAAAEALGDLGVVVLDVVGRPFASRRHGEMLDCLREFRKVALKEDEIDVWNEFLVNLKKTCNGPNGNREFWGELVKQGKALTLVGETEAEANGGTSAVSDTRAGKFLKT